MASCWAACLPCFNGRWWWAGRARRRWEVTKQPGWEKALVHGEVAPGWEPVREEFLQNFRARGELGAGVCVYFQGRKVVDLWGGYRDGQGSPWQEKTLVPIFSCTKGVSMLALVLLQSRGRLDFEERVARYWPEFAQHGKGDYTVRQLVDHACGLAGPSPPITLEQLLDKEVAKAFFAAARPDWATPGDYKGYMAITLGNYQSALVQTTDEKGRTAGQFLREELFRPLGIEEEIHVGLPKEVKEEAMAQLDAMAGLEPLFVSSYPEGFIRRLLLKPWSYTARTFNNPRLSLLPSPLDYNSRRVKEAEYPSVNGQATARALATVYKATERAINGAENPLAFSEAALQELMAPARPARLHGWREEVMGINCALSHGMLKPPPAGEEPADFCNFGLDQRAFGTPGAGGSFGFCDPAAQLAFAYVPNRLGQYVFDDPREFSLRLKAYECASRASKEPFSTQHLRRPHWLVAPDLQRFPFLAPL